MPAQSFSLNFFHSYTFPCFFISPFFFKSPPQFVKKCMVLFHTLNSPPHLTFMYYILIRHPLCLMGNDILHFLEQMNRLYFFRTILDLKGNRMESYRPPSGPPLTVFPTINILCERDTSVTTEPILKSESEKWKSLSGVRLFTIPWTYTVPGILQARILEWVAFPFSRGSSQPRDQTQVSWIAGRFSTSWATREAQYWYIIIT